MTTAVGYLIVPGIDGSDDEHWQSRWEAAWAGSAKRIEPASWSAPDLDDWVAALDRTARQVRSDGHQQLVIVAHSLGCWAAAEWIAGTRPPDVSAFMVAVPDVSSVNFPRQAAPSFLGLSATPLGVRSLMVASDDDPYCSADRAADLAAGWGAGLHCIGPFGHLNSESGLGIWLEGQVLLSTLSDWPLAES